MDGMGAVYNTDLGMDSAKYVKIDDLWNIIDLY